MHKKALYTIGVFFGIFYIAAVAASQGVLLSPMVEAYALADAEKGMMVAARNFGCLLAFLSAIVVMGRIPKAGLMLGSTGALALLLVPISAAPAYPLLVLLFLILGVAFGFIDTLASSIIADEYEGKAKTRVLCALHAVYGISGIVTPFIFRIQLDAGISFQVIYKLLAASGFALFLYMLPINGCRLRTASERLRPEKKLSHVELGAYLCSRDRMLGLIYGFFYAIFLCTVTTWCSRYFELDLNDVALGALSLSLFWGGTTASRLIAGALALPTVRYLRVSGVAGALVMTAGVLSGNGTILCISLTLTALIAGAAIPMLLNHCCSEYPENTLLATTSVFFFIYASQTIWPPLLGLFEESLGLPACMLLGAAALALSGILAYFIRQKDANARVRKM